MRVWVLVFGVMALLQFAPLKTTMKRETDSEFRAYARQVEVEWTRRWKVDKVQAGDVLIEAGSEPNPRPITDGLIHDWVGSAYMPNTTVEKVLAVLQGFDRHAAIYPQVVKSRLIKRVGDDVTGYWRLEQKGQILPAVFDVTQTAHWERIGADKWICVAHADNIRAVEDAGSEKERLLPVGEGIGLVWKLYSYWVLQREGTGVMAECRTLSLSRGVPGGVAWMIRPFINTVPRQSMESTLRNTLKAAAE